jgi:hypothetical protein
MKLKAERWAVITVGALFVSSCGGGAYYSGDVGPSVGSGFYHSTYGYGWGGGYYRGYDRGVSDTVDTVETVETVEALDAIDTMGMPDMDIGPDIDF